MQSQQLNQQSLTWFRNLAEVPELNFCEIAREFRKGELFLIIDCPGREIASAVWRQKNYLLSTAHLLNLAKRIIISNRGKFFTIVSSVRYLGSTSNINMITESSQKIGCSYLDLLAKVYQAEVPTYVMEMPGNWHWGQPQKILLTSAQVTSFSGKPAPKLHNEDVTLLYDRVDLERLNESLIREFEANPDGKASLKDVDFLSYTIDRDRESFARGEKMRYVADFEVLWVRDLNLTVRVSQCKLREAL